MATWALALAWIFAAIFLCTAAITLWVAAHYLRRFRRMRLRLQPPGRTEPGLARVRGKASGSQTLISPLTRTPCFYYRVEVQKWTMTGIQDSDWDWLTIHSEYGERTFYLEDESGKVAVNPHGAEFDLDPLLQAQVSPHGDGKIFVDAAVASKTPSAHDCYDYLARHPPAKGEAVSRLAGPPEPAAPDLRDGALEVQSRPRWTYVSRTWVKEERHLGCQFFEHCIVPGQEYEVAGTCADDVVTGRTLARGSSDPVLLITSKTTQAEKSSLAMRAGVAFALAVVFGAVGLLTVGGILLLSGR